MLDHAGVLAALIDDQAALGRLTIGIELAIAQSFVEDSPPTRMTHSAVKERFELCMKIVKLLRGDAKWGVDRIVDHLPTYLRCELDGASWAPDTRTVWMPGDGS